MDYLQKNGVNLVLAVSEKEQNDSKDRQDPDMNNDSDIKNIDDFSYAGAMLDAELNRAGIPECELPGPMDETKDASLSPVSDAFTQIGLPLQTDNDPYFSRDRDRVNCLARQIVDIEGTGPLQPQDSETMRNILFELAEFRNQLQPIIPIPIVNGDDSTTISQEHASRQAKLLEVFRDKFEIDPPDFDLPRCSFCHGLETSACNNCFSAYYCSDECQRADSTLHSTLCESMSSITQLDRPKSTSVLAILLPVDEKKPKLVWVNMSMFKETGEEVPELGQLMGPNDGKEARLYHDNNRRDFKIGHSVTIFTCGVPTPTRPGLKMNKCAEALGIGSNYLYGSAVIMRNCGKGRFADIMIEDLRHAIENLEEDFYRPSNRVKGVKIASEYERNTRGIPLYTRAEISKNDPRMFRLKPTDISCHVGIPLLIWELPNTWQVTSMNQSGQVYHGNTQAISLTTIADPNSESFGAIPERWRGNIGSVFVARQDGKPLSVWDVEAMVHYCKRISVPMEISNKGSGSDNVPSKKEVVEVLINRRVFERIFREYQRAKANMGLKNLFWATLKSPLRT